MSIVVNRIVFVAVHGNAIAIKRLLIVITCLLIGACASSHYTASEQAYIDKIEKTPLVFVIAKDSSAEYKAKAQIWLSKYSQLPIQWVTGNGIQTEPATAIHKCSYSIAFQPVDDSLVITVNSPVEWNARMLAYYLRSGEFLQSLLATD